MSVENEAIIEPTDIEVKEDEVIVDEATADPDVIDKETDVDENIEDLDFGLEDEDEPTDVEDEPIDVSKMNKAELTTYLKENLTKSELRSYKTTMSYVKDTLKGTDIEEAYKAVQRSPELIKLMTVFANQGKGSTGRKAEGPKVTEIADNEVLDKILQLAESDMSGKEVAKGMSELKNKLSKQSNGEQILAKYASYFN